MIMFPPTYKLDPNKNELKDTRIPGWTDRILFRYKEDNKKSKLLQINYECGLNVFGSDHRPVFG